MNYSKTEILISSLDSFSDCWEPLAMSFEKYWPDCEFKKNIIVFDKDLDLPASFHPIYIKYNNGFSVNLSAALDSIEADNILFFLVDFWLESRVHNAEILSHLEHFNKYGLSFLKIDYFDRTLSRILHGNSSKVYLKNSLDYAYSINTSIAFWRRIDLLQLLKNNLNPWQFEKEGHHHVPKEGFRAQLVNPYLDEKYFIRKVHSAGAVSRGLWTRVVFERYKHDGVLLNPNRKVEGKLLTFLQSLYVPRSPLWYPLGLIVRLLRYLKLNV